MTTVKKKTLGAAKRRRRPAAKTAVRRKRRTPAKRGFLSALGGADTQAAVRSMTSGVIGGGLYLVYEDQVNTQSMTPEKKGMFALLGAYVATVYAGKPNIGAGIIGAAAYDFFKVKGLLGDESEQMRRQQWADPLQNVPVMLSDDEMYLAAGGDPSALQDGMQLQDGTYLPDYANSNTY